MALIIAVGSFNIWPRNFCLLQEINNLGTTMLVVTHDQNLVKHFRKRVISINEGVVVNDGLEAFYGYEDK